MFKGIKGLLATLAIATGAWAQGNVWDGSIDTTWYTNNKTATSYTITTPAQLAGLARLVNGVNQNGDGSYDMDGKTITLGNDIMLNDTTNWQNWGTTAPARTWTAIGVNPYIGFQVVFNGTFDGAGHIVGGVYINTTANIHGGLFGYVGGTIKNLGAVASYVKGSMQAVGGLAGCNKGTITNSYATGSVTGTGGTGTNYVGGLVGENSGTISNSYATGNVTSTGTYSTYIGGLVGCNNSTITNSYATGNVTGTGSYVGGLVGRNYNTVTNSYYDSQTSGQSDNTKGTPKTTIEMKTQATYSGWDFADVWGINPSINNGYPYLRVPYPVTNITAAGGILNDEVGIYNQTYALNATVQPSSATYQTIVWSITSTPAANRGEATISGNSITFTKVGNQAITVRATIANGLDIGVDYTKDFQLYADPATGTWVDPGVALNTTYAPGLRLSAVSPPANYIWSPSQNNPNNTSLSAGDNQKFYAFYTDPSGNYNRALGQLTVNVAKADYDISGIAFASKTATYDGQPQSIEIGGTLPTGLTVSYAGNGQTAAGTYTVTATFATSDNNYNTPASKTATLTINKAAGTFVTTSALNTTYTTTLTLANVTPPTNYAWVTPATTLDVSKSGQSFAATYTDPSGNYNPATGNITVNVAKAAAPTGTPRTEHVAANYAHTYSFDLAMLLPNIPGLAGETYSPAITDNTSGILGSLSYTNGNTLEIPVTNTGVAGQTATITVTVSSQNYQDFAAVITVETIDKKLVDITGISMPNSVVYNGNPHGYTGTPILTRDDNGETVAGIELEVSYEATDGKGYKSITAPTAAGTYRLTLKVPDDAAYIGEAEFEFTISKANGTGTVAISGWTYGQAANAPTVSGQTAEYGEPSFTYSAKDANAYTATVPTNAGEYTVKATFAATANYNEYSTTADFAIAKANGTGTVAIAGWTYGQAANAPTISGKTAEYGEPSYTYSAKGANAYTATVPTAVGNYTVKATFAATANYNEHSTTADFAIAAIPTYAVTVTNGTGGGSYEAGTAVTITANAPSAGQQFKNWNISPAVTFTSGNAATPTAGFAMPAEAVTATAVYEAIPANNHLITVTIEGNGTANANVVSAPQGTQITLTATPNEGNRFVRWDVVSGGVTLSSATTSSATFAMADNAVAVKAVFEVIPVVIPTYAVTVTNGTGGGSYEAGTAVTITANAPPTGQQFKNWTIAPAVTFTSGNATTPTAEFTMLAEAVTATAVYEAIPANNHLITVTIEGNGIANANVVSAPQGTQITLTATPNEGNRFVQWQVVSGGVTLSSATTSPATFAMADNAVAVKAVFEVIPTPILPLQLASGNKAVQTHNGLNLTATTNATVEIFNLKGSLISRQNFASGVHAIRLGHLPKGMYIVKATFGNEKQILRMAVK